MSTKLARKRERKIDAIAIKETLRAKDSFFSFTSLDKTRNKNMFAQTTTRKKPTVPKNGMKNSDDFRPFLKNK